MTTDMLAGHSQEQSKSPTRKIGVAHYKVTQRIKGAAPVIMGNTDSRRPFGHHLSSQGSGSSRRSQTRRRDLHPKHSRILSTRSLDSKSKSDITNTETDMLTRQPYSKAQMAAIYAVNQALLEDTGFQERIPPFGSEGSRDRDDIDIDTMFLTEFDDFDSDIDISELPDGMSYQTHQSISAGSRGNLTNPYQVIKEYETLLPHSPNSKWTLDPWINRSKYVSDDVFDDINFYMSSQRSSDAPSKI